MELFLSGPFPNVYMKQINKDLKSLVIGSMHSFTVTFEKFYSKLGKKEIHLWQKQSPT